MFAAAMSTLVRTHAAIAPNIIGACTGESNLCFAASIGGHRTFRLTKAAAIIDLKVLGILYPGLSEHQVAERVLQLNIQSLACVCCVVVGIVTVSIGKQMEAAILIPKELVAAKACHIQKVTGFKHDSVRGCTNCHKIAGLTFIHGEIAVKEIHQIFGKAKDSSAEVGASGQSVKVYIAPIATIELFVSINQQLKSSGFVIAVTVGIIEHFIQTVFSQVNCFDCRHGDRNIGNVAAVFISNILRVKADG